VTRGLADTSVFIASETGRGLDETRLPDELAVSVITVGELRAGVLMAEEPRVRAARLDTLTYALGLEPLPVDEPVAEAWALLRLLLRDAGRRLSVNDSWIAATAIAHEVPVVTQDDDFAGIDGLDVLRV
jgi:predicted nucleic acid-binding protein